MLYKTRVIANLLLSNNDINQVITKVRENNMLHVMTESTQNKYINLILCRLKNVDKKYLYYISNGTFEEASLLLLVIIANKNRILGDFLRYISKEIIKKNIFTLDKNTWNKYIDQCLIADQLISKWSQNTHNKIKQVVFSILYDTKIIDRKNLTIQTVRPPSIVLEFLDESENNYVRNCVQGIFV